MRLIRKVLQACAICEKSSSTVMSELAERVIMVIQIFPCTIQVENLRIARREDYVFFQVRNTKSYKQVSALVLGIVGNFQLD